jgi:hypothetical protein
MGKREKIHYEEIIIIIVFISVCAAGLCTDIGYTRTTPWYAISPTFATVAAKKKPSNVCYSGANCLMFNLFAVG